MSSKNSLQGDFGIAYVKAITHAAGYFCQEAGRGMDADGVDFTVLAPNRGPVVRAPRLDLQVKTFQTTPTEDPFPYDLALKNYDELRDTTWQSPRILVVVIVPEEQNNWVASTEQELIMRHCGYWLSLRGREATANTTKTRIQIQRSNRFHVDQLQAIMNRLCAGGEP